MDGQTRILIVDDDADVLVVLGDLLESLGYFPVRVRLAEEALAQTRAAEFDLVLLDLGLPDASGADVLRQIKQLSPDTEVIIVTGHRSMDSAIAAVRLNAFDYIEKPFGLGRLADTIERALARRRERIDEKSRLERLVDQERKLRAAVGGSVSELLSKQHLLESIVDECPDAIIVTDAERRAAYFNDAAVRLLGGARAAMLGVRIDEIVEVGSDTNMLDDLQHGRERMSGVETYIINQLTQQRISVEANLSAMRDQDGEFVGVIGVYRDVTRTRALVRELNEANLKLQALSITDPVTGLFNHRHFQASLRGECERVRRYDAQVALLMIDLDYFKAVNDSYGHTYGDEVLKRVAAEIRVALRISDIPCRYGGDEFAVILPETPLQNALNTAERLRVATAAIRIAPPDGSPAPRLGLSIGVAAMPDDAEDAEGLLKAADGALYGAKEAGRGCVVGAGRGTPTV